MRLDDWFTVENRERAERGDKRLFYSSVARDLGVKPQTVWAHAKGRKKPSATLISAYQRISGGQVTLDDWFPASEAA